jgi:hypothetical protein
LCAAAGCRGEPGAQEKSPSPPASPAERFLGRGTGHLETLILELRPDRTFLFIHLIHFENPPVEVEHLDGKVTREGSRVCLEPAPSSIEPCFEVAAGAESITVIQRKDKRGSVVLTRQPRTR